MCESFFEHKEQGARNKEQLLKQSVFATALSHVNSEGKFKQVSLRADFFYCIKMNANQQLPGSIESILKNVFWKMVGSNIT